MPTKAAQVIDQVGISSQNPAEAWLPIMEELRMLRSQLSRMPENMEAQSFVLPAGSAERILGFDLSRNAVYLVASAVGAFVGPTGSWRPGYTGNGPVSGFPIPYPPAQALLLRNAHETWVYNSTDADVTVSWIVEKFAQN